MRATAAGVHQMTKVCHHCIPLYLFIGSKNTAVLQSAVPAAHQRILVHDKIVLQFSNLVITAYTHCRHHQAQSYHINIQYT